MMIDATRWLAIVVLDSILLMACTGNSELGSVEQGIHDGHDDHGQTESCGNGKVHGHEACDDGNTIDGDGCDATCHVEAGYVCAGAPQSIHEACATPVTGTQTGKEGCL